MYYIGTYNQAIYYDNKVSEGEKLKPRFNWANPIQSQTNANAYAILQAAPVNGCPRTYTHSNMILVKELPAEFTPKQKI